MAMREKDITCIELFAGAGGLALGGEMAGLKHKLLIENDKNCVETLKHNRPEWNVVDADIVTYDFTMDTADVVTGGFPCQSFSQIGTRGGLEDTRGTLFYDFARAIDDIRPKIFVAENVRGLLSCDGGEVIDTIMNTFEDLHYNVQYKVLNSWDYNVAQKRNRLFIVGTQEGYTYHYPEPTNERPVLRDVLCNVPESKGTQYPDWKREIFDDVPEGGCYYDLTEEQQKKVLGSTYGKCKHGTGVARRLSWDEPSVTILTRPTGRFTERIHPSETRPLTPRECARIQSFPDQWEFMGSMTSQYKQVGNAVPPLLACAVLGEVVNSIRRGEREKNYFLGKNKYYAS